MASSLLTEYADYEAAGSSGEGLGGGEEHATFTGNQTTSGPHTAASVPAQNYSSYPNTLAAVPAGPQETLPTPFPPTVFPPSTAPYQISQQVTASVTVAPGPAPSYSFYANPDGFVSPTVLQASPQTGFGFSWGTSDYPAADSFGLGGSQVTGTSQQRDTEHMSWSPGGPFSDSEQQLDWTFGEQSQEGADGRESGDVLKTEMPAVSRYKRAKKLKHQGTNTGGRGSGSVISVSSSSSSLGSGRPPPLTLAPAPVPLASSAVQSGSSTNSSLATPNKPAAKLRSASQKSKNVKHSDRDDETVEERRSRTSHNLVEKQYRNRLNQQFESLLNALPESMRSPTPGSMIISSTGGGGIGSGEDGATQEQRNTSIDLGAEKRLSKAEVLDMSRRYIQTLERERDKLELERKELIGDMDRLRAMYARGDEHGNMGPGEHGEGRSSRSSGGSGGGRDARGRSGGGPG